MYRGRPADMRKMVRAWIAVTILVWATQTLVSQWGFGAELEERFVPADFARPARVELMAEALIVGGDVRLKDIARWSENDGASLEAAAELIVARFTKTEANRAITVQEIKRTLEDAGVNVAGLNFSGVATCRVSRTEPRLEAAVEKAVLASVQAPGGVVAEKITPALEPRTPGIPLRTLRDLLTGEVADQLGLPLDALQIRFAAKDEKLVNLVEGAASFEIEPATVKNLGDLSWNVTIVSGSAKQKVAINAHARAWQTQYVAGRPLAFRQSIREQDVEEKRVLISRLNDASPLSRPQIVGQQAARDIRAGTVLTASMIAPAQLAKPGQLVTVQVETGRVHLTWIAEAREPGYFGQSIRVRKPGTREEYTVQMTGPQEGKLIGSPAIDAGKVAAR